MKTLTIRNIPDDLYLDLTKKARQNKRSMQKEVLASLEKTRIINNESPVEQAKRIRLDLAGRNLGNTVKEIREERGR